MRVAGDACLSPSHPAERRERHERRNRRLWSIAYGSFHPRRRAVRRTAEHHVQFVDWHHPHLLGVALGIVLLCSLDAFLTLTLISQGASEVNPVMEALLYRDIAIFAVGKMFMTGAGVLTLVALSRCRLFGKLRVDLGLYLTLAGYIALIAYEMSLLNRGF
ncbi:MAG TPA: DUF5658 family protein [Steroidobacteraceae bacterium]|nr:DUF5658 family protein [Steroidobacteraceae bacterium]